MANRRLFMFVSILLVLVIAIGFFVPMVNAQSNCESDCPCPVCLENTYTINVILKVNGLEPMDIYEVSVVTTQDNTYPAYMNFAGEGMKILDLGEGVKSFSVNFDHEVFFVQGTYNKYDHLWEFPMNPVLPCDEYTFVISLVSIHADGKPELEEPQIATPTEPESTSLTAGDIYSNSVEFGGGNNSNISFNGNGNNGDLIINSGPTTYDYSMDITNVVNISVTYVTVEVSKPERPDLKLTEHKAPITPPMAPKPEPRYDLDVHDRHSPFLETHPVLVTPEEALASLLWSFYEWLMSIWPFVGVVLTAMGAIVLFWLLG